MRPLIWGSEVLSRLFSLLLTMYIHVRVHANAKKELWVLRKPSHFEASVREKAERNEANRRVVELAAIEFGVSVKCVRIVNGHQSPSKLLSIDGLMDEGLTK